MINIYSPFNTTYTNNGNATLVPIYCTQKVAINGVWQVVMEHPYDKDGRWQLIENEAVIKIESTAVEYTDNKQLYRIYKVERGLHSVYCEALPIALDAFNESRVLSIKADNKTGTEFASVLNQRFGGYTITSNINTLAQTAEWKNTNLIEILNGGENCFVKLYGGEIKYDNTKISINSRLDSNPANFKLRLGRDIEDIKYAVDDTDVVTRIYPLSASGGYLNKQTEYAIGAERYVDSPLIGNYPKIHNEFVKTDYMLCTTKEDSKDYEAYNGTMNHLNSITTDLSDTYMDIVNDFLGNQLGIKGNVEYLQMMAKKTKKKDGYSGIIEVCEKSAISQCINVDWKKLVKTAVDASLEFIDDLEEPEYELVEGSADWTVIVSGIEVYKGLYEDKINFNSSYTCTKLSAKILKDDNTEEWKEVWSGSKSGTFSVDIKLDSYPLRQYKLDYNNDGAKTVNFNYGDLKFKQYTYHDATYGNVTEEWVYLKNRWRYFDSSGYMYPASYPKDNFDWIEAVEEHGGKNVKYKRYGYVLNPYGISFLHNQWYKIEGTWYYFKNDGTAFKSKDLRTEIIEGLGFETETDSYALTIKGYEEDLYQKLYQRLTDYAEYLYSEGVDKPRITLDVSQVDLNNIVGYSGLPTLKLGHNVQVDFNGLTATERIVEIEYDCVTKRNKTLTIGAPSETITAMINRKVDVGNGLVAGEGVSIEGNVITVIGDTGSGSGGGGSEVVVTPKHNEHNAYYNIADISVDGVVKHLYGGLEYWHEDPFNLYQSSISGQPFCDAGWSFDNFNFEVNTSHAYAYNFNFKKKNVGGTGLDSAICVFDPYTKYFYLVSWAGKYPSGGNRSGVEWQYKNMIEPDSSWRDPTENGTDEGYSRKVEYAIAQYGMDKWAISRGFIGDGTDVYSTDCPFTYGNYPLTMTLEEIAIKILEDSNCSMGHTWKVGMSNYGKAFYLTHKTPELTEYNIAFLSMDGVWYASRYMAGDKACLTEIYVNGVSARRNPISPIADITIPNYRAGNHISISDNEISATYTVFGGEAGLVPSVTSSDHNKFLKGDGTWAEVSADISVTPILDDGIKIAEIEVDGVTEEIYAPTGTKTIAYRSITPTAYEALSSTEKNNGTLYLVSENADGSMGFFVQYRNMTESDYNSLSTSEKNNGTMYLLSNNADNSMGINFSEINMNDTVVCLIGGLNGNNNV